MKAKQKTFNQEMQVFIDQSPTPFHATANMKHTLAAAGFVELKETESWQISAGQGYFVTRNGSSMIAFRWPKDPAETGIRMCGAHTDSPCLKLKPNSAYQTRGYWQLGVEVYGGVLLNPWFDRDLSLAGRITVKTHKGQLRNILIDLQEAVAIIPSLAIHLDRDANQKRAINAQTYLPAIISGANDSFELSKLLSDAAKKANPKLGSCQVVDFELSLYPTEKSAMVGIDQEFIASARLDNLLSCFVAIKTLLDARKTTNQLIVCNDHEEVGSSSTSGARGTFLQDVLTRLLGDGDRRIRAIANSAMISTDNAHGIHPNFADKHDNNHGPILNDGPVIKVNSNQSYATNSETAALFKLAAEQAKVSVQSFVTRTDMGCGSTIGPLTATALGIRTADVGVPTFAMHSIRELAGRDDGYALYEAMKRFFQMSSLSIA